MKGPVVTQTVQPTPTPNLQHLQKTIQQPKAKSTPTNDSNHLPPHLIAAEARNFTHHKRVGDYFLGEVLGEGSFAKTRLGAHVFSGEKVAVKIINKEKAKKDPYVFKNLRREGQILRKVNHPNIIRLLDVLETENNYYLITTYCSGGEFIDRIEQRKQLSENEVRRHIRQLLDATEQLHQLGIVHRDLKVENLLLDSKGNLQVIDFGLSNILPAQLHARLKSNSSDNNTGDLPSQKTQLTNSTTNPESAKSKNGHRLKTTHNNTHRSNTKQTASVESASSAGSPSSSSPYSSNGSNNNPTAQVSSHKQSTPAPAAPVPPIGLKTQCGSPAYAAPELLAKKPYNEKVDCWSIGVIAYALLTGRLPFTVEPFRIQTLYRKMVNGEMNSLPSSVSSKCRDFILKMLTPDPANRPSAASAAAHEWLTNSRSPSTKVIAQSAIKLKPLTVSQLDSHVIKHMAEKLDFIGGLNDMIENVIHSRPSRALAAYFLFQQKFERELAIHPSDTKNPRRQSLVLMADGSLKQATLVKQISQNSDVEKPVQHQQQQPPTPKMLSATPKDQTPPSRMNSEEFAAYQKRLIYSNPPARRNTTQTIKVGAESPRQQRPHSTVVDADKFSRMRIASLQDQHAKTPSKLTSFGKRVQAAKRFFEKAPKWMAASKNAGSHNITPLSNNSSSKETIPTNNPNTNTNHTQNPTTRRNSSQADSDSQKYISQNQHVPYPSGALPTSQPQCHPQRDSRQQQQYHLQQQQQQQKHAAKTQITSTTFQVRNNQHKNHY